MWQFNKKLVSALVLVSIYAICATYVIGPMRIINGVQKILITPKIGDYKAIECPAGDYVAVAYFGQSNSTNTVKPKADGPFPSNLIQWDWKSEKCFEYREPLLGADFIYGNPITYAAVRWAAETDKMVMIVPFGFGPSTVLEWAYGVGSAQQKVVFERLKANGISPKIFLWHHGESDVPVDGADESIVADVPYFRRPTRPLKTDNFRWGLGKKVYGDALDLVVARTFEAFPDSYFGIALVSHAPCLKRTQNWEPLRQAQREVASSRSQSFISADSDAIRGDVNRHDTCHFSAIGAKKLSEEYYQSVGALGVL